MRRDVEAARVLRRDDVGVRWGVVCINRVQGYYTRVVIIQDLSLKILLLWTTVGEVASRITTRSPISSF